MRNPVDTECSVAAGAKGSPTPAPPAVALTTGRTDPIDLGVTRRARGRKARSKGDWLRRRRSLRVEHTFHRDKARLFGEPFPRCLSPFGLAGGELHPIDFRIRLTEVHVWSIFKCASG